MRPLMRIRPSGRTLIPSRFNGFENQVRRLLEETFGDVEEIGWSPAVEITETADALELTAELPGMSSTDVDIELEDDVLTIHGVKTEEKEVEREEERGVTYRVAERRYGEFSRSFTVPSSVDGDAINADFRKGVLTVHMPKTAESRGRKIEVEG